MRSPAEVREASAASSPEEENGLPSGGPPISRREFLGATAAGAALALPPTGSLLILNCTETAAVTWPAQPPNGVLESTASLNDPISWLPVPGPILDNGAVKAFLVPAGTEPILFFRLH
jgi:hypothetical protein